MTARARYGASITRDARQRMQTHNVSFLAHGFQRKSPTLAANNPADMANVSTASTYAQICQMRGTGSENVVASSIAVSSISNRAPRRLSVASTGTSFGRLGGGAVDAALNAPAGSAFIASWGRGDGCTC